MELSALDFYYIVKELQFLRGSRLEKVYYDKKIELLVLKLHSSLGTIFLRATPKALFYTSMKQAFQEASNLAMILRKHIQGSVIDSITQQGFERIVLLKFKNKKSLVLEFFSKGNIILLDENNRIITLSKPAVYRHRTLRPRFEYKKPPETMDPRLKKSEDLVVDIANSQRNIVQFLAVNYGLGGFYSELVCKEVGIDKKLSKLTTEQANNTLKVVKALFEKPIKPCLVDNGLVRLVPFMVKGLEIVRCFESFNQGLVSMFFEVPVDNKKLMQLEKLKKALEKQRLRVEELKKQVVENKNKAEAIYKNYQEIANALKKGKKQGMRFIELDFKNKG